eukprot:TRINITY_DN460_c0_g1_i1.p1 TRINITY_DN460_c0_g1~~TRINITY_DN460_c0_g1_i1.p1  ORF type:complete len:277 (-),score=-3.08 TRINITY_DN460_c0_g1_i1:368-1198(-)
MKFNVLFLFVFALAVSTPSTLHAANPPPVNTPGVTISFYAEPSCGLVQHSQWYTIGKCSDGAQVEFTGDVSCAEGAPFKKCDGNTIRGSVPSTYGKIGDCFKLRDNEWLKATCSNVDLAPPSTEVCNVLSPSSYPAAEQYTRVVLENNCNNPPGQTSLFVKSKCTIPDNTITPKETSTKVICTRWEDEHRMEIHEYTNCECSGDAVSVSYWRSSPFDDTCLSTPYLGRDMYQIKDPNGTIISIRDFCGNSAAGTVNVTSLFFVLATLVATVLAVFV